MKSTVCRVRGLAYELNMNIIVLCLNMIYIYKVIK